MTAGWQIKALSAIADCCLGKMLDKAKNRGTPQPYLRNINVRWFDFDLSDLLEMRFEDSERDRYTARKGDLLICEGGYPGRAGIWEADEPIYFQKAVHRVRFHEPERARWVLYYLWASVADGSLKRHFTGSGIQHFTGQALARLSIPLPPLEEQRRIVAMLDESFIAILTATANSEKNLANARALFEAELNQSMDGPARGWERKSLGSLGNTITGNTPKTKDAGNFGDFIPFIKPGDFKRDGTLNYENEGLSEAGALSSRRIASGSALMVCIGATIGKSGYAERDITANQQINALLPATGVSGKFVYYQFLTSGFQKAVLRQSGQATLPIISKSKWNDLPVWLPPHDKQLLVVDALDRLLTERLQLEALVLRRIEMLAALKQSLLHRAFSGELVEREPLAA